MPDSSGLAGKKFEVTEENLGKLLYYVCVEEIVRARDSIHKWTSQIALQKILAKMKEAGIPLIGVVTNSRIFCEYTIDYKLLYEEFKESGFIGNDAAYQAAKALVEKCYPNYYFRALKIANANARVADRTLIEESDKKDAESVLRARLVYSTPELLTMTNEREDPEQGIKGLWIGSIPSDTGIVTADLQAIRHGKLTGLVKSSGRLDLIDCRLAESGQGELIFQLTDSELLKDRVCTCVLRTSGVVSVDDIEEWERQNGSEYLVFGKVEPSLMPFGRREFSRPPFSLRVLGLLRKFPVMPYNFGSDESFKNRVVQLAREDAETVYRLLIQLLPDFAGAIDYEGLMKIHRFCKNMLADAFPAVVDDIQSPTVTLDQRSGDCKAKVCLEYALLMQTEGVEKVDLLFLNTYDESPFIDHVRLEVKVKGLGPIVLDSTNLPLVNTREVSRLGLPIGWRPSVVVMGTTTLRSNMKPQKSLRFTVDSKDLTWWGTIHD